MRFNIPIKFILCFFIVSILLSFPLNNLAFSRPPSRIVISYDLSTSILEVEIKHITPNIIKHFIRKVIITKNDVEVFKKTYPSQPQPPGFTIKLAVAAKKGDIFIVKAFCNEAGIGEEKFDVKDPDKT